MPTTKIMLANWVWADVLAIPFVSGPGSHPEDEMLKVDMINNLPLVYSRVKAAVIIDALVLQLHPKEPPDVAVALACVENGQPESGRA